MTALPPAIAAEMAQVRLNAAMSMIKSSADAERQVANILEEAVQNVPTSPVRGSNVNTSA